MNRIFRLFISSTFSDFMLERERLQRYVFPELEEYCASKGAKFLAVDLRWGITEAAQVEHDQFEIFEFRVGSIIFCSKVDWGCSWPIGRKDFK